MNQSAYEAWATRLFALAKDASVPIDDLPLLDLTHYTTSTVDRLVKHLVRANTGLLNQWNERLARDLSHAQTPDEIAAALVNSRAILYKRVQLGRHPMLDEAMREQLEEVNRKTIEAAQRELEQNAATDESAVSISSTELVDVLRANPLTAVLDPAYEAHVEPVVPADAPLTGNLQGPASPMPRAGARTLGPAQDVSPDAGAPIQRPQPHGSPRMAPAEPHAPVSSPEPSPAQPPQFWGPPQPSPAQPPQFWGPPQPPVDDHAKTTRPGFFRRRRPRS